MIRIGGEFFVNNGMYKWGIDKAFDDDMEIFYEVNADTSNSYIVLSCDSWTWLVLRK